MASKETKVKKYMFTAGKAGAVGMVCCGVLWLLFGVAMIFLFTGIGRSIGIVCIVVSIALFVGARFAWQQLSKLSKENSQKEQEENALEYERDFTLIVCPECNGTNKVRKETVAKCQYCGTLIQG
jgi:FlaA1/EpsC-like NDP-sugar epimerase